MGTRNLTCVVLDGVFRVAQYCQWDGYPSGQGFTALNFLRTVDLAHFTAKVRACKFGTPDEIQAIYKPFSTGDGWMTMAQSKAFAASEFGYLSRDTGADILRRIMESNDGLLLQDSSDFAADGLFCEWAYVVDLDKQVLEVYSGFHKEPVPDGERFAYLNPTDEFKPDYVGQDRYYPVQLLKTYDLAALPATADFVEELDRISHPEEVAA